MLSTHPPAWPQSDCGILLTTYETMRLQRGELVGVDWGYVVLDEGHKIRWVAWFGREGVGTWAALCWSLLVPPPLPLLLLLLLRQR